MASTCRSGTLTSSTPRSCVPEVCSVQPVPGLQLFGPIFIASWWVLPVTMAAYRPWAAAWIATAEVEFTPALFLAAISAAIGVFRSPVVDVRVEHGRDARMVRM